jgi:hypothetical protein
VRHVGHLPRGEKLGHSLPSNAEVKNKWSSTSTKYYVLNTWRLITIGKTEIFLDPYGGLILLSTVLILPVVPLSNIQLVVVLVAVVE